MRWTAAVASLLVLVGCSKNHRPLIPSLIVPALVQRGDSVRAWVFSYDKDADSLHFFIEWGDVDWSTNYDEAVVEARRSGKPIFLLYQEAPG